jgi:putative sigma-54 modulation protein
MTVEEAVLEMDKSQDYLVYRDAQTDKVSVLLRRRDGHFDLVEG